MDVLKSRALKRQRKLKRRYKRTAKHMPKILAAMIFRILKMQDSSNFEG